MYFYAETWLSVVESCPFMAKNASEARQEYLQAKSILVLLSYCDGPHKCTHEASSINERAEISAMYDAIECVEVDMEEMDPQKH